MDFVGHLESHQLSEFFGFLILLRGYLVCNYIFFAIALTRSRVCELIAGLSCRAFATVENETPAFSAMNLIVIFSRFKTNCAPSHSIGIWY